MNQVFVTGYSVLNALGSSTQQLSDAIQKGNSALRKVSDRQYDTHDFWCGAMPQSIKERISNTYERVTSNWTEQMLFYVLDDLQQQLPVAINQEDVLVILSSTKGNIANLSADDTDVPLVSLGKAVQDYCRLSYTPKVVSTACISGLVAIIQASRRIEQGTHQYVVVVGADAFTPFVYKGFQSFHAIENGPCRPFDAQRNGINLGECAAGIILSAAPKVADEPIFVIAGCGLSNDANHLSGPSRTGQELADAIAQAVTAAQLSNLDIALISAHGTATVYNDEMEAKALHLAGVQHAPVYSLKSYIGHTLGAAGIVETVMGMQFMKENIAVASNHFEHLGTTVPINVLKKHQAYTHTNFLKTASGFGGCNAALVVAQH